MMYSAQNLTTSITSAYDPSVLAKSSAGFSSPNFPSAMALNRSVFFTPKFYGGWIQGASARRPSERSTNLYSPATLMFSSDRGSSPLFEDNSMKDLSIGSAQIRQFDGLYNLNDLHKSAGNNKNHQPSNFLRLSSTKDLIEEISHSSHMRNDQCCALKTKQGGRNAGTYVCKELVYAYAMWISAKFSLKVIRAFDQLQAQSNRQPALPAPVAPQRITIVTVIENGMAISTRTFSDEVHVFGKAELQAQIGTIRDAAYLCASEVSMTCRDIEKQLA